MRFKLPINNESWGVKAALSRAQRFLVGQTTRVDDAMLYLQVSGSKLSIRIPSFEMNYNTTVTVSDIEEEDTAAFYLNAKMLWRIVSGSSNGDVLNVIVDHGAGMVIISRESSRWQLPITKSVSYGFIEHYPETGVAFDPSSVVESINRISGAVSLESIRPYLRAVNCVSGRVRACNGSMYIHSDTGQEDVDFSIPVHLLSPFKTYLKAYEGESLTLSTTENAHHVIGHNDYISFAKPSIDYPDLDSLLVRPMRSQVPAVLRMGKEQISTALKNVGMFTDKDFGTIQLHIAADEVEIKCVKEDGAESISSLPCQWGSAVRDVTFNITDLQGVINSARVDDTDFVELKFANDTKDRKSPVVVEGENTWAMLNQLR